MTPIARLLTPTQAGWILPAPLFGAVVLPAVVFLAPVAFAVVVLDMEVVRFALVSSDVLADVVMVAAEEEATEAADEANAADMGIVAGTVVIVDP